MGESTIDAVVDASEGVLSRLESHGDVAYAEVGGVVRRATDAVATADRVRSATDVVTSGVWCRAFADGAADYRFTTSLDEDHLADLVERSVRSGEVLGQETPASYDRGTVHRATHPGWAAGEASLDAFDADEKAERVRTAFADALADLTVERTRVAYRDERVESVVLTTTGSAVNATLERAAVEPTVVPTAGPKRGGHAGATTGVAFLDSLSDRFEDLVGADGHAVETATEGPEATVTEADEPVDEGAAASSASSTDERRDIAFGPRAAAELFHHLSHYLEIDSVYFGSSPYEVGDRLGPPQLTIEDGVSAGSWAARAYDAEARPTQPVTLVDRGVVRNHLHDTASAIAEGGFPAGNVVPSLGFEQPPRVHARHLDVSRRRATPAELRDGADVAVERVGSPRVVNEATRTKRGSAMPPSVMYARDVREMTPSEFDDEPAEQRLRFPVAEGYRLEHGDAVSRLPDATVEVALSDFEGLTALGAETATVTGTCPKHKSTLPYAVTAPGVRLGARILVG